MAPLALGARIPKAWALWQEKVWRVRGPHCGWEALSQLSLDMV